MEDKGLIAQAEAGQRVKNTATIGTGLHLLYKLLLLPNLKWAGEYEVNTACAKRKSRLIYNYDVLGHK